MYLRPGGKNYLKKTGYNLFNHQRRHDKFYVATFDNTQKGMLYIVCASPTKFQSIEKLDEALKNWQKRYPDKSIQNQNLISEDNSDSWIFEPEVNEPKRFIMAYKIKYSK